MWEQVGNTEQARRPGPGNCAHPTFSEFLQEPLNALPISQDTLTQNGEEDAEKAVLFGHEFATNVV